MTCRGGRLAHVSVAIVGRRELYMRNSGRIIVHSRRTSRHAYSLDTVEAISDEGIVLIVACRKLP